MECLWRIPEVFKPRIASLEMYQTLFVPTEQQIAIIFEGLTSINRKNFDEKSWQKYKLV